MFGIHIELLSLSLTHSHSLTLTHTHTHMHTHIQTHTHTHTCTHTHTHMHTHTHIQDPDSYAPHVVPSSRTAVITSQIGAHPPGSDSMQWSVWSMRPGAAALRREPLPDPRTDPLSTSTLDTLHLHQVRTRPIIASLVPKLLSSFSSYCK